MAYLEDTEQLLTITLLQEGIGSIVSFTADKTTAREGDPIEVSFTLRNNGDTGDTLFARIIDNDTQTVIASEVEFPGVAVGSDVTGTATLTMPARQFNIRLEAGHVE